MSVQPLLAAGRIVLDHLSWRCTSVVSRGALALGVVVLCVVLGVGRGQVTGAQSPANSTSVDVLQQQRRDLEESRSDVSQQRQRLQELEGAAQERLTGLQRNLRVTDEQIKENEQQLQQAIAKLARIEADLSVAQATYQQKQRHTVARLRFLQRQRSTSTWATLLQSKTLEQLLARRRQLKRVYQADQQVLIALKADKDRIRDRKLQVELQKNQVALLSQYLLARKADYTAEAQAQQQLVQRLTTDLRALEAAEIQLAKDTRQLTLLIQKRLGVKTPGGIVGTGTMASPVNGQITGDFGWRQHPILKTQKFHAGADFAVPQGTPIQAADRGAVIFAGWYGGYGNAVILDHGSGITTLYAHASQLYVTDGQSVQKGQTIAAVGSTGFSTGPHLHFEVRLNGEPTNPRAFL